MASDPLGNLTWEQAKAIAKARPRIDGTGEGFIKKSPDYSGLTVNGSTILEPGEPVVYKNEMEGTWRVLRPCGCSAEVALGGLKKALHHRCSSPLCPERVVEMPQDPCRSCGGTLRYRKLRKVGRVGRCVTCNREKNRRRRSSQGDSLRSQ